MRTVADDEDGGGRGSRMTKSYFAVLFTILDSSGRSPDGLV